MMDERKERRVLLLTTRRTGGKECEEGLCVFANLFWSIALGSSTSSKA